MKRSPPHHYSLGMMMRAAAGNATATGGGAAAIPIGVGGPLGAHAAHPRERATLGRLRLSTPMMPAAFQVQHPPRPRRGSGGAVGVVRTLAVYSFGEGWTGALGSGSLASHSPDSGRGFVRVDLDPTGRGRGRRGSKRKKEPIVKAVAAGWGHTALVVQDREDNADDAGDDAEPSPPRLLVCGRPHEFRTLLRLNRLPDFVRNLAVRYSFWHTYDSSVMDNNDAASSADYSSAGPGPWGRLIGGRHGQAEGKKDGDGDDDAGGGGAFSFSSAINALGRDHQYGSSSTSCILPYLTEIPLPYGDCPATASTTNTTTSTGGGAGGGGGGTLLAASAGFTAVVGSTSHSNNPLYAFGLNPYGQCGVGYDSNNVWVPTPVVGLSTQFAGEVGGRAALEREYPIASVALGLQHAIGLDVEGNIFAWGKGERGQLGDGRNSNSNVAVPIPVRLRRVSEEDGEEEDDDAAAMMAGPSLRVTKIAAGFNHSACVTECNLAFVWGKNVTTEGDGGGGTRVTDAPRPVPIRGLPPDVPILDVSCGSHHTALSLADGSVRAIGIATDDGTPLLDRAVSMIRPGGIPREWFPLRQFVSGFDRTTIVSRDGRGVLEVRLWSREGLREDPSAVTEPDWFRKLKEEVGGGAGGGGGDGDGDDDGYGGGAGVRVRMVDRGWLHTVVVTDDEATEEAMDYDRASDSLLAGAGAATGGTL